MIFVRAMQRIRELRYGIEKVSNQSFAVATMQDITGWKQEVLTKTEGLNVLSIGMQLRKPKANSFAIAQTSVGRTSSPINLDIYMTLAIEGVGDLVVGEKQTYKSSDPDGKPFWVMTPIPLPESLEGTTLKSRFRSTFPSGIVVRGGSETFIRVVELRGEAKKGAGNTVSTTNSVWEPVVGDWTMPSDSGFARTSDGYGLRATQDRNSVVIRAVATTKNTGFGVQGAVRVAKNGVTLAESGTLANSTADIIATLLTVTDVKVGDIIRMDLMKIGAYGATQAQVIPGSGDGQTRISIY